MYSVYQLVQTTPRCTREWQSSKSPGQSNRASRRCRCDYRKFIREICFPALPPTDLSLGIIQIWMQIGWNNMGASSIDSTVAAAWIFISCVSTSDLHKDRTVTTNWQHQKTRLTVLGVSGELTSFRATSWECFPHSGPHCEVHWPVHFCCRAWSVIS
jgi:hypothetical protein